MSAESFDDLLRRFKDAPHAKYRWTADAEAQMVREFPALIRGMNQQKAVGGGDSRMDNFLGFLTPGRRQALYSLVAVGVGALLVFGVVTEDQVTTTTQAIAAAIATLTALMAALNTNRKKPE